MDRETRKNEREKEGEVFVFVYSLGSVHTA